MPTETVELTKQQKMSAGLRELADFYDKHPEFPTRKIIMFIYTYEREEFINLARQLRHFTKEVEGDEYKIVRDFGGVAVQVYAKRNNVCNRRLVTQTVEVEVWDCPDHLLSGNSEKESTDE